MISRGYSGSTVRLKLSLLSRVFSVASKKWGMSLINPVFGVSKPAAGKARTRRLMNDEEQRLLTAASAYQNPNIYPLIIFALETGMRRSEIHTACERLRLCVFPARSEHLCEPIRHRYR